MAEKKALLLARMDPPEKNEDDWNRWYNEIHVSNRREIPGFLSWRRFEKVEGIPEATATPGQAKYLALYDVTGISVLNGKAYEGVRNREFDTPPDSNENSIYRLPRFCRLIYREIDCGIDNYTPPGTKYVFLVGHDVPRNRHGEFNAWYNTEHIPDLLSVPGFVGVRRFALDEKLIPPITGRGGVSSQYLTIWDIESEKALTCPEFVNKSASPWTRWVRSWYTRKVCVLFRQIYLNLRLFMFSLFVLAFFSNDIQSFFFLTSHPCSECSPHRRKGGHRSEDSLYF
jgi:hypothetical protein